MMPNEVGSIVELRAGIDLEQMQRQLSNLTTSVALLVQDDEVDCRTCLVKLPVPCVAMAFVSPVRLRWRRRIAVDLSLSRQFACSCRVFNDAAHARLWLMQRLNQTIF